MGALPSWTRKDLQASRVGKRPAGADLYVHWSAVDELPPLLAEVAHAALTWAWFPSLDLVKFDVEGRYVSLLEYDDFEGLAHPANWVTTRMYRGGNVEVDDHSGRANPTILHRKELFVGPSHPRFAEWAALTRAEEAAGLLVKPPGYRRQWEERLARSGWTIVGHELVRSR